MRRAGRLAFTVVALVGNASLVQAQKPPNPVGTWKGQALAVGTGANPYRVQESNGPNFSKDMLEFTFNVTEQHDGRFAGSIQAGKGTEALIGALRPPYYTEGVIVDDDGRYAFKLRDAGTIDLCYDHIYPKSKVVACYSLTKQ